MGLIDKDYVIGAMEESKKIHGEYSVSINNFINSLKSVPTVDAEPVKHGHWINQGQAYNGDYLVRCSVCKRAMSEYKQIGFIRHYCPNCGAKMDEVSEWD